MKCHYIYFFTHIFKSTYDSSVFPRKSVYAGLLEASINALWFPVFGIPLLRCILLPEQMLEFDILGVSSLVSFLQEITKKSVSFSNAALERSKMRTATSSPPYLTS